MAQSLLQEPIQSYEDSNGKPLNGGQLFTYDAGTLTPRATYQDAAGTIPNTNPVVLNERGEAVVYGSGNYRMILKNSAGATIWDRDNVLSAGGAADQLRTDLANSTDSTLGDALVAVKQPYANSVARTQHQKNSDVFTGIDAGMVGDGVADDLTALTAAAAGFPGPVDLPAGKLYKLGASVAIRGSHTLWDAQGVADTPYDTDRIQRIVDSLGSGTDQVGGHIIRSTINAGVTHHEFGYFSVITSKSTAAMEHVGMYSQISSAENGASVIWGGVDEVKNVQPDGTGTSVNHAMAGREIDVVNKFAFSDTLKKIGVECIAFGGGENTEAFSVYAANNTRGDGTYNTGHWRYGFRIVTNAIDGTNGIGLKIESSHGSGIQITGASASYGIHLNPSAASSVGLNVESNYSVPIAVPANKQINLNGTGGSQGIQFNNTLGSGAVILQGAGFGVTGHTTFGSAASGAGSALPATPEGYASFWVNGTLRKIPFYN